MHSVSASNCIDSSMNLYQDHYLAIHDLYSMNMTGREYLNTYVYEMLMKVEAEKKNQK